MIIDSPIISGSYLSTGSLSQTGNVSITGSLTATAGISGSFSGSGANLFGIPASGITGLNLSQISSGSVSASISPNQGLLINTSVSASNFSGSFSGSGANLFGIPATGITGLNLSQISSGSVSASISPNQGLLINTSVSASNFTGSFTGSLTGTATSASYAFTASSAISASYSQTASYLLGYISPFPYTGSAAITGSLIVTGSLTVSTLVTSSGVRYVIADQNGLLSAQTASAAIFTTQQVVSTANQTTFPITNGYSTGYVTVFVNGTKLSADEYVDTSGTNIIFLTGSTAGDVVEFQKYLPAAGVSNNTLRTVNYFTATLGQTVFTVNYTPGLLDVFYNGAKLDNTEYTAANGTSILLATGSNAGDSLEVDVYSYQVGAFSGIGGTGAANQLAYFNTSNSITGSNAFTVSGSAIIITGSLIVSGSGTFTNIGPAVFSGSVTAVGGFSGSFSGNADSASLAQNSLLLQGTGSIGFTTTASFLAVSSSQQQISASLLTLTASYTALSSSYIALSASYNTFSGSESTRITKIENNYATTGSNSFRANQSITGSLVVSSTITAQTLVVQTVTSSILYSSGSNNFGNQLSNTQTFTGSIQASGSSSHFLMGGSVGIGITNPTRPLQINAAADTRLVITDSNVSTTAGLYLRQFGSASAIVNNSNGTFQLATNDTYFLTANASGQVGIGTTQPSYTLDVSGSVQSTNYISQTSSTISGLGPYDWSIMGRGVIGSSILINDIAGANYAISSGGYNLTFSKHVSGSNTFVPAMIIYGGTATNSTSKVGIGTTVPATPLDIFVTRSSGGQVVALTLTDGVTGAQTDGGYKAIRSSSNNASSRSEIRFIEDGGTNNDTAIGFATQMNASALLEKMRISRAGYVTKPYQPFFQAYSTGGSWTTGQTVVYAATLNNVGSGYNTSTGRFTAPVAGVYLFRADFRANTVGSNILDIKTSTGLTTRHEENATYGNYFHQTMAAIYILAAGDYVYCYAAGGTIQPDGSSIDRFEGYLLG